MKELKTLKDLEEMNGDHLREPYLVIPKEKLKAEAVKWVKNRIKYCNDCNLINVENYNIKPKLCTEHLFWFNRFNLTEEDLK